MTTTGPIEVDATALAVAKGQVFGPCEFQAHRRYVWEPLAFTQWRILRGFGSEVRCPDPATWMVVISDVVCEGRADVKFMCDHHALEQSSGQVACFVCGAPDEVVEMVPRL